MKRSMLSTFWVLTLITGSLLAAPMPETPDPFAPLLKHLNNKKVKNDEEYGWTMDRHSNAKIFNEIRKNLGSKFDTAVLKFIGQNIERHYNAAIFLFEPTYLENSSPKPELALLILQQGIALIERSTKWQEQTSEVSFRVLAALLSEKMGLRQMAIWHKAKVTELLKKGDLYSGSFPAISDEERKIFDSLPENKK